NPRSLLFHAPLPHHLYPLSLHDALPISSVPTAATAEADLTRDLPRGRSRVVAAGDMTERAKTVPRLRSARRPPTRDLPRGRSRRSEEHTSELQSRGQLVCRLLLAKNKEE